MRDIPGQPHYVRDYRRLVSRLATSRSRHEAMALAVGDGDFHRVGASERSVLEAEGLQETHYIIDAGCGSGRLATALNDMPQLRYLGTEVVPELLNYAMESALRSDWRFELVDGLTIPETDPQADIVTFFSVLTHLKQAEQIAYLREAARVLKPGGKVVATFLDPAKIPKLLAARVVASRIKRIIRSGGIYSSLATERTMTKVGRMAGLEARFPGYSGSGQNVCVYHRSGETVSP